MIESLSSSHLLSHFSPAEARAIEVHKYFLSLEAGYDVGWEYAATHWLLHFSTRWRQARLQEEMDQQRNEIQKHKWIESERAGRDLGQSAVQDWIVRYAAEWRRWRENLDSQS